MKYRKCCICRPEGAFVLVNPPHCDPERVKPWVHNNLASPKLEGLFGEPVARLCQPEKGQCPTPTSCTTLKCPFISTLMGVFWLPGCVCALSLAFIDLFDSVGKLGPGANGNFNAQWKTRVPLGPLADPSLLTLSFPEKLWSQPCLCQRIKGAQWRPLGPMRVTEGTCPSVPSGCALKALSWERRGGKEMKLCLCFLSAPPRPTPNWGGRLPAEATPGNVPAAYIRLGKQACSAIERVREMLSPRGIWEWSKFSPGRTVGVTMRG